jgi:hypothetical protein
MQAAPTDAIHTISSEKPRHLLPEIQVLPSPPLTRESSLASAGLNEESNGHHGQAQPRPPHVHDEGAPTADEVDIADRHLLRTSTPFLDMASSVHSIDADDMLESPAEEHIVLNISAPDNGDLEAGYGQGGGHGHGLDSTSSTGAGPSRYQADDHPLARLPGVPDCPGRRSIPAWETVEPPPDNNLDDTDTHAYHTLRSKSSYAALPSFTASPT